MDKFGIFNLVNSLYSLYKNTQNQKESTESVESKENPLFSAIKNFSNFKEENKPQTAPASPPKKVPLQAQMLNTAKSHDEHVKRVLNKIDKL